MTSIPERIRTMRAIADAADGRPLTKAQVVDFEAASELVVYEVAAEFDTPAVDDLAAAVKSAKSIGGAVAAFESWARDHNGGRKSSGALVGLQGPYDENESRAGLRPSYKSALSWGNEFVTARREAVKALLDPGVTPVSVPLASEAVADARQAKFVYELLPTADAPDGHFAYLRQTVRTNAAAVVATGALKPVSAYGLERIDDTSQVIAHLTEPIDRFWLEDAPTLRQFLDQELRYGLARALDARAVLNISTDATPGGATVDLAGIRSAITALEESDFSPTGIVMTPADWETVESEATTTFAANDNAPAATEAMTRRLYSIPVMVTNSIGDGEALVGDFAASAVVYRTGNASISMHDSHPRTVDATTVADFRLNQLVMRAEMRAEVAVTRPAGFILIGGGS